jgi:hypothetical protein
MTRVATLTMTAAQRDTLKTHLFPGDGKEAAALLLCGRRDGARRQRLLVREVHPVPYAACTRREVDSISWPIEWMDDLVDEAAARGLSLVKVHSHGVGYNRFSKADDASDTLLFPGLHALVEGSSPHASVVMTGDGAFFGRTVGPEGEFETLERITVVGDDIEIFYAEPPSAEAAGEVGRSTPAFGKAMTAEMARLLGAVIGASGTGGIVNEQLGRLGFGVVLQVDPEVVERKNLNRILNASAADAAAKLSKVEVAARAVAAMMEWTTPDGIGCARLRLLDTQTKGAVRGPDYQSWNGYVEDCFSASWGECRRGGGSSTEASSQGYGGVLREAAADIDRHRGLRRVPSLGAVLEWVRSRGEADRAAAGQAVRQA